jgi:phosphoribosylaminoimidazole-succinocarboxamide synthase
MIRSIESSGLTLLHRGKVRDSFRLNASERLLVATDRISAFDLKLKTLIPRKGEVLSCLSAFWFARTRDIVPSHFIELVDPQATRVKEAQPLKVEVVVRGALCGSMWRAYQSGRRSYSGVSLPEGLTENALLPSAVITPTTKAESDEEIRADEVISRGLVSPEHYRAIEHAALALFAKGQSLSRERGLLLADTKYEFGLLCDEPILIDEIHTPDSSRYWDAADYANDPIRAVSFDKEYVRRWMRSHEQTGALPLELPLEVVQETTRRYVDLYTRITGTSLPEVRSDSRASLGRLEENLKRAGILRSTDSVQEVL